VTNLHEPTNPVRLVTASSLFDGHDASINTEDEKRSQLHKNRIYRAEHSLDSANAIARLKEAASTDENVFAVLMDAARVCTLGQITEAFFEVGGQYRRNV
jgi:methylmalonyl-CoA mutase